MGYALRLRGCYDMYKIRLIDIGIQTIEHLNAHQWVGWDIQTKEMLISFVDAVYVEQQTNIPIDTLIQSINYNSYISFINILINNIDKLDGIPIFLVELKQLKRSLFISFNNLKDDHIEINKIININYLFGTYSNFIDSTFLDVDNATIMEEMEEMYNYEINLKKM
jgi:glycerophosphoryl diester phosphodiesterase